MIAAAPKRWSQKPTLGTRIQRGHPLAQGLVGAFLMNDGGGVAGLINAADPGTPGTFGAGIYAPSWDPQGLSFGNAHGTRVTTTIINTKAFTWVASVNPNPASGIYRTVICEDGGEYILWDFDISSQNLSTYTNDGLNAFLFGGIAATGVMMQVALVRLGDSITNGYLGYKNGVQSSSAHNSGGYNPTNPLTIGFRPDTANQGFDGLIQYAYIYNRALSATEMLQLYTDPYCFMQSPQRRYWAAPGVLAAGPLGSRLLVNQSVNRSYTY